MPETGPFARLYGDFDHGVPKVLSTVHSEVTGIEVDITETRMPAVFMGLGIRYPDGRTAEVGFGSGREYVRLANRLAVGILEGTIRILGENEIEIDDRELDDDARREMADEMLAFHAPKAG